MDATYALYITPFERDSPQRNLDLAILNEEEKWNIFLGSSNVPELLPDVRFFRYPQFCSPKKCVINWIHSPVEIIILVAKSAGRAQATYILEDTRTAAP